jgi:hypothetical protein
MQYGFTDVTFAQALKRAQEGNAADLRAAKESFPAEAPIVGMRAPAKPVYAKPYPLA